MNQEEIPKTQKFTSLEFQKYRQKQGTVDLKRFYVFLNGRTIPRIKCGCNLIGHNGTVEIYD